MKTRGSLRLAITGLAIVALTTITTISMPGAFAQTANDDFNNATVIISLPFTDTIDTTQATAAPDDPAPSCFGSNTNSVWYAFTAPTAGGIVGTTFRTNYEPGTTTSGGNATRSRIRRGPAP